MILDAVRHGRSECNRLARWKDDPTRKIRLTAKGRRQTARARDRLSGTRLDAAVVSVRPAGRIHLEVEVLYTPGKGKC